MILKKTKFVISLITITKLRIFQDKFPSSWEKRRESILKKDKGLESEQIRPLFSPLTFS